MKTWSSDPEYKHTYSPASFLATGKLSSNVHRAFYFWVVTILSQLRYQLCASCLRLYLQQKCFTVQVRVLKISESTCYPVFLRKYLYFPVTKCSALVVYSDKEYMTAKVTRQTDDTYWPSMIHNSFVAVISLISIQTITWFRYELPSTFFQTWFIECWQLQELLELYIAYYSQTNHACIQYVMTYWQFISLH